MANETITRTVRADWKGSLRAEIHARECPPFFSDEPVGRGGLFEHPTPSEYLLELDITVISSGTEDELERVKALFRAGCIMYLFMKSAVPVEDRWTLVQQG
jgi:hypothetical protein